MLQDQLAFKEGVAIYIRSHGYFEFVLNLRAEAERAAKLVKDLGTKINGLGGAIANAVVVAREKASAKAGSKKEVGKSKGTLKKTGAKRPKGAKKSRGAKHQEEEDGADDDSADELAKEEAELKAELKRLRRERVCVQSAWVWSTVPVDLSLFVIQVCLTRLRNMFAHENQYSLAVCAPGLLVGSLWLGVAHRFCSGPN